MQTQLFKLILHCRSKEYSVAFVHNQILWHYWRNSPLQQLQKKHWLLNEEIGEITLSILARSAQNTPQHAKTRQLVENYSLITHVHHLSQEWNETAIPTTIEKQFINEKNLVQAFENELKANEPKWGEVVVDATGKKLSVIWDSLKNTDYDAQLYLHFESVNRLWMTPTKSSITRIQQKVVKTNYQKLLQKFL